MSFDWRDYIKLAEDLKNKKDEAAWRSAISRAYYGAFCLIRDYKKGVDKYITHSDLIDSLITSKNRKETFIGHKLRNLRSDRNKADYKGNSAINHRDAERAVRIARRILQELSGII